MPLPQTFIDWINTPLTNYWWSLMLPDQQDWLATNGVPLQYLKSHTDSNIPTYTSAMVNFNLGRKVPNNILGKPSDVPYTWQNRFPLIVSQIMEAQYIIDVFEAKDTIGLTVCSRVLFDGALWETNPTLTIPKSKIIEFAQADPTPTSIMAIDGITIDNRGWLEANV